MRELHFINGLENLEAFRLIRRIDKSQTDQQISKALKRASLNENQIIAKGEKLFISLNKGKLPRESPSIEIISENDGLISILKPSMLLCHDDGNNSDNVLSQCAKLSGKDIKSLFLVNRLDFEVSGLMIISLDKEKAVILGKAFEQRQVRKTYLAQINSCFNYELDISDKIDAKKALTKIKPFLTNQTTSIIMAEPVTGRTHQIRKHLAGIGLPITNDLLYGGLFTGEPIKLFSKEIEFINENLYFKVSEDKFIKELKDKTEPAQSAFLYKRKAIEDISCGRKRVFQDEIDYSALAFSETSFSELKIKNSKEKLCILPEKHLKIFARVFNCDVTDNPMSFFKKTLKKALTVRKKLILEYKANITTIFRLLHGEAEGFPGIFCDIYGEMLRVEIQSTSLTHFEEEISRILSEEIKSILPVNPAVLIVRNLKLAGNYSANRIYVSKKGSLDLSAKSLFVAKEAGLKFHIDHGLNHPSGYRSGTGFFIDQRKNRKMLAEIVKQNSKWLNLFCHTGAFTVHCLEKGASETVSVDLSKAYLKILDRNVEINSLPGKNWSIAMDARRYLEKCIQRGEKFDGIIIDPPASARAGKKFFSVKKEAPKLAELALRSLKADGHLFFIRNDQKAKDDNAKIIREEAKKLNIKITQEKKLKADYDFPSESDFDESKTFRGVLVKIAK